MMKRVFVISPGSFSLSDNDGLTLSNLFQGYDKKKLAQFYIQGMSQNENVCDNYYRVTDRDALKSIIKGAKGAIRCSDKDFVSSVRNLESNKWLKSPITMLLRNVIWQSNRWRGKQFNHWLDSFNPEVVFLEIGDNASQINIACNIASKRKIPLLIHNTEGFYFFRENYMKKNSVFDWIIYPIFHSQLKRAFRKAMNMSSYCIYSCNKLKRVFDSEFPESKSCVLYNKSNIDDLPKYKQDNLFKISYLGNLAFNRPYALIEVADVLQKIDIRLCIDVYGKTEDEEVLKLFKDTKGINFHGLVPYSEVKQIIADSDILLHVEHNSRIKSIEYGFSTKIPDSLASGRCFFVYSPLEVAGSEYLYKEIPQVVAKDSKELDAKLRSILNDNDLRKRCIELEMCLAKKNHDSSRIISEFRNIINSCK